MALLNEDQKNRLRESVYTESLSCENCMPRQAESDPGETEYTIGHWELQDALLAAIERTRLEQEVAFDPEDNPALEAMVSELALQCPTCGFPWTRLDLYVADASPNNNPSG